MNALRKAYFDTNVFAHIHNKVLVTEADLIGLRSALREGKISILASILNLEEILPVLKSSPDLARALFRLVLELADLQRLVKPTYMLLRDDISCHARGEALTQPFMHLAPVIQWKLSRLVNPRIEDIAELLPIIEEIKRTKDNFLVRMGNIGDKFLQDVKGLEASRLSFDEFWKIFEGKFAEDIAQRLGVLEECGRQGMEALLDVRSVRLYVGASLSLTYALIFEGRIPKPGDSRDMLHAVSAAAADVFITYDRQFARVLARIPMEGFQVTGLQSLLHEVH